jgi:hypothetical protein
MIASSLTAAARLLGGEVVGGQVLCPGPGHSPRDRSLAVRFSPAAPDGFIVHSFAGDDPLQCRDYVRQRLGLTPWAPGKNSDQSARQRASSRFGESIRDCRQSNNIQRALTIWDEAIDPTGSLVETYLRNRGLELSVEIVSDVIRFHPECPWKDDSGATLSVPSMIAAFRDVGTDQIVGIQRTRLARDGTKIGRKMLGRVESAAIKIDPDHAVGQGLSIGEGLETCLSGRVIGLRPCWALGSAGAIKAFPVVSGINSLIILRENDKANEDASTACAERWANARVEVVFAEPRRGKDLNDALKEYRHGRH